MEAIHWASAVLSELKHASESPGRLSKHLLQGPGPRVSDSVELNSWGPGICISNALPGDADAADSGTTL